MKRTPHDPGRGHFVVDLRVVRGRVRGHAGADMTGPLAQQFATVRDNTHHFSFSPRAGSPHTPDCGGCKADAALSVIERHVQDMASAEVVVNVDRFGVWTMRQNDEVPGLRYPAEHAGYKCAHGHQWWMDASPRSCPICNTITFAALPAREKGEE